MLYLNMRAIIVIGCLSLMMTMGCQSLEENLQKLKSEYASDRIEAIDWLFYNADNKEANKQLLKEAVQHDKNEVVRSLAIRFMALEGNEEYVPFLKNSIVDASPLVRMEAIQGIGTLNAKSVIPDIVERLSSKKEPDLWVRLKILKTLEYMDASQNSLLLVELLEDSEPAIRFHALSLLEKFTGKKLGIDKQTWKTFLESTPQS